jgi:hypothetical protein
LKNESIATFLIVVVIVSGALGVLSWAPSGRLSNYGSTTTTTETIPCVTSLFKQTSTTTSTGTSRSAENRLPDYGPFLGNFSAITVVLYGFSSTGKSYTTATLLVLNRSSSSSGATYLVNATARSVGPSVTMESTQNFTTTIIGGNQTRVGSVLARIASDGSPISTERTSGNLSFVYPLQFFIPLISIDLSSSNHQLHRVNSTIVTIGSTRMVVTNFELPSEAIVEFQEGCNTEPSSSLTVTFSNLVVQAGRVPGTNFDLVTQYSERLVVPSNSSPSAPPSILVGVEKVTSFTVADFVAGS